MSSCISSIKKKRFFKNVLRLALALILTGCQALPGGSSADPAGGENPALANDPQTARVTFIAEIPAGLEPGQQLMIEILDEITGLAIVPQRLQMEEMDATHFQLAHEFQGRSIIKYRYYRKGGNPSVEFNSLHQPVRYRFLFTDSETQDIHDQIAGWNNLRDTSLPGIIEGKITNSRTSIPVAGILVACGGDLVISGADGSFRLDKVKPGLHTLSAMSMDGGFYPFHQEVRVNSNSMTPADFSLSQTVLADVRFILSGGKNDANNTAIRIIGDLSQTGNTFSNQGAEQSVLSERAPVLPPIEGGKFEGNIRLPIGMVYNYKYSLGDGLWNAERDENGGLTARSVLISSDHQVVTDDMKSFNQPETGAIFFSLTVPENTPADDVISIQFNPFDWSPPLPMQPAGERTFQFALYGPQDLLGEITYRYCRNYSCDKIAFSSNGGSLSPEGRFHSSLEPQQFIDEIPAWWDWQPSNNPTVVLSTEPVARNAFVGGIETLPDFNPLTYADSARGLQSVIQSGAKTIITTPTWSIVSTSPLIIRQVPGKDISASGLDQLIDAARQRSLKAGIFPRLMAASPSDQFQAYDLLSINPGEWQQAMDRFYIHFASLSEKISAQYLVIDGDYLNWRDESGVVELLIKIRSQFKGQVLAAASPADIEWYPESILEQFDGIYLLLECPLFSPTIDDLENNPAKSISSLLDGKIKRLATEKNLPVLIAIEFPAIENASQSCHRTSSEWTQVRDNLPPFNDQPTSLQSQTDLYNEIMSAAAARGWINGVISRGFTPGSARTDSSSSVYGKPAFDILWYWFTRLR